MKRDSVIAGAVGTDGLKQHWTGAVRPMYARHWLLGPTPRHTVPEVGMSPGTAYHLIHDEGLTIQTNLFGTTYYSLVGLHATHVVVGLIMLSLLLGFSLFGLVREEHSEKVETLALYWHFVDAVWVVVFTVVYVLGR